ncbi:THxN family PEP-CTERM protein [Alishewanella sp. HH-ZS]|jgi:hypothetical protein|uniref:THxN family PEP-CTERM protein n=1 Tax=Alishewanella sp. HH-ZS TaxID=1856684 RepID=UPI00082375FB|nr:THxN family PEP-CTERM protein [Alishewanella sp. HH-ZS]OCW93963.1 hypothetical protein A9165_15105 [Alishewanella sp. HH-ZS]
MKKILKGAIAGVALLLAPFTQAAMVTQWDYTVTLQWVDWTFGAGTGTQTTSPSLLTWGSSGGNHAVLGGTRSGLGITESPADGIVNTNGPAALTNIVTHYNNTLSGSHATLTNAVLQSTLLLTPLNPVGDTLDLLVANFSINFIETPNQNPCPFPSLSVCDDIFVISTDALNASFDYNGFTYFISIIETSGSLNPMDAATCAQAGIVGPCLGFKTQENQFTAAQFAFLITTEPVTIVAAPGVLALMGLGLIALVGVRRRKQLVA